MDGYEVCRRLKAEPGTANIPIIFLSALGESFDKLRAFESGGADYVTKPFRIGEVQARVRVQIRLRQLQKALEVMSRTDALTGLANRRRFDEVLAGEWSRAERRGDRLSLLMIDVDFFKLYNAAHGHLAGDACLRRVGAALQSGLSRSTDLVARYGGEEFVAVLPGLGTEECGRQAECLRAAVRALAMPHGHLRAGLIVTVSISGATALPGSTATAADAALYRAKAQVGIRWESQVHDDEPRMAAADRDPRNCRLDRPCDRGQPCACRAVLRGAGQRNPAPGSWN